MPEIFIGLMSGTSLDGVDAVAADFEPDAARLLGHVYRPFPGELKQDLLALSMAGGIDELGRAALAANTLARIYASAVGELLSRHGISTEDVRALGCHGQTVRHAPDAGYTLQLSNNDLLAELTGIDVIGNFRGRDIAAGGQGAPLVPAFHWAAFGSSTVHRVIVNIGGIANLSDLLAGGAISGFDCGPGNMLLDAWAARHLGQPYDDSGKWAASGQCDQSLLDKLLADDYFHRAPPKSAGREQFNLGWLSHSLKGDEKPVDVQATLLALTAAAISNAIHAGITSAQEVYVCGGGAHNAALMTQLANRLAPIPVSSTDRLGVPAQHVEALAFAWLAKMALEGKAGNVPAVTGASGPRILGAHYRCLK